MSRRQKSQRPGGYGRRVNRVFQAGVRGSNATRSVAHENTPTQRLRRAARTLGLDLVFTNADPVCGELFDAHGRFLGVV